MNNSNTSSLFYTDENEEVLLEKLGLYNQCFDYNVTDLHQEVIRIWPDWNSYPPMTIKKEAVYLPFFIYICECTKQLELIPYKV